MRSPTSPSAVAKRVSPLERAVDELLAKHLRESFKGYKRWHVEIYGDALHVGITCEGQAFTVITTGIADPLIVDEIVDGWPVPAA